MNPCKDFVKPLPFLMVVFMTCSVVGETWIWGGFKFSVHACFSSALPGFNVDGEPWPMWNRPLQGILLLSLKDQECVWSRCWNNTRWIPNLPILNFQSKKVYFSISIAPKGCTLCKIQRSSWNSTGWILNHWYPLLATDYNANPLPRWHEDWFRLG